MNALVWEAGPEPVLYPAVCTLEYLEVSVKAMMEEIDGLVAAGTFTGEVTATLGGATS